MYCWITAFLLELLLLEAPSTNSDHASSVVQKVVIISSGNLQTNATWEKCCSRAPVKVDTSHVRDQDPPVVESRSARSSPARGATGSPATPRTRAGRRSWGLHPAVARRVWWELNTSGATRLPETARRSWRPPGQLAWLQCNANSQGRNRFVCGRLRFQTVFLFCEDVDDGLVPDPHSPPRTTRAAHEPRVE
ncbi:uncharacterized protein LOC142907050 isoform X5 [Petromyzon marinus]